MNRKRFAVIAAVLTVLGCLLSASASAETVNPETVSTAIGVKLTLSGGTPEQAADFTLVLHPNDDRCPMPASDTLVIRGAGEGSFGPITFTEPNDYRYTLYQADGKASGYTYDARVYTVTVQVTSDAQGKLTATVSMRDGSGGKPVQAAFANRYAGETDIPKTGYGGAAGALTLLLALGCAWLTARRAEKDKA